MTKAKESERVLVTGGTGFVGKAVLETLCAKPDLEIHVVTRRDIEAADRENLHYHQGNVLKIHDMESLIQSIRPHYLIHLAWNVAVGQYMENADNLDWTAATLQLARMFYQAGGKKAFFCGTCFEYALTDQPCHPYDTDLDPVSLYGEAKADAYRLISKFCEKNYYDFVWGRLFYLYGENENPRRAIPYVITNLLQGKPVICENSKAIRDYIYVKDAGRIIVQLLFSGRKGAVNVCSGRAITMEKIFSAVGRKCRREELITYEDQPAALPVVYAVPEEIEGITLTPLEEGIGNTVEWWMEKEK